MDLTVIALAGLVAIAASGLAYAFLFSRIEVEKKTTTRVHKVAAGEGDRADGLEGDAAGGFE